MYYYDLYYNTKDGKTPLMIACSNGNQAIAEFFISVDADVDIVVNIDWNNYYINSSLNYFDFVRMLSD